MWICSTNSARPMCWFMSASNQLHGFIYCTLELGQRCRRYQHRLRAVVVLRIPAQSITHSQSLCIPSLPVAYLTTVDFIVPVRVWSVRWNPGFSASADFSVEVSWSVLILTKIKRFVDWYWVENWDFTCILNCGTDLIYHTQTVMIWMIEAHQCLQDAFLSQPSF